MPTFPSDIRKMPFSFATSVSLSFKQEKKMRRSQAFGVRWKLILNWQMLGKTFVRLWKKKKIPQINK